MPRHKLWVLEGLDGVGKTVVAQSLAARLGGSYYKTPPAIINEFELQSGVNSGRIGLRDYVDKSTSVNTRYLFYLMCMSVAAEEIGALLQTMPVVCDRYYYSTIAYHCALNSQLHGFRTELLDFPKPDHAFLLTLDEPSRKQRMLDSELSHNDKLWLGNAALIDLLIEEYRRFHLVEICRSSMSVDETVAEILAIANRMATD